MAGKRQQTTRAHAREQVGVEGAAVPAQSKHGAGAPAGVGLARAAAGAGAGAAGEARDVASAGVGVPGGARAAESAGAPAQVQDGAGAVAAVREQVRSHYAQAALKVIAAQPATCGCGSGVCGTDAGVSLKDPVTSDLYDAVTTSSLPEAAVLASLGCGNPTALAELRAGEVVLDLGSGGGIDVLLSARRVGPTGKAYGLDMTDEMLALARANAAEAGATNVEFLQGHIEAIPLPDASVDVIVSNCVINLSADKRKVLAEAYRVLKPGGRFAVSDVVVRGEIPPSLRRSVELWVGCVAGALEEGRFLGLLVEVGFEDPAIEPTRIYRAEDARGFIEDAGLDYEAVADQLDGRFISGFVRARKPEA